MGGRGGEGQVQAYPTGDAKVYSAWIDLQEGDLQRDVEDCEGAREGKKGAREEERR